MTDQMHFNITLTKKFVTGRQACDIPMVDLKWLLLRPKWLMGHQTDCCLAHLSAPRSHQISARCMHRFVVKQERDSHARWAAKQSVRLVALHWAEWLVVAQQAVRAHDESKTSIDGGQAVQQPQRLHRLPQTRSESGQYLEGTSCPQQTQI